MTKIEWVRNADGTQGKTWNPVTGCTPISEGCRNCYAQRMAKRLAGRAGYPADDPFRVTFHENRLDEPLRRKKPTTYFVCSMGDLFHEDVPDEDIDRVFGVMARASWHQFILLTKRARRMMEYSLDLQTFDGAWRFERQHLVAPNPVHKYALQFRRGEPLPNVILGVSVEDQDTANERIPILLRTAAAKRIVSYEPAIESVDSTDWLRCPEPSIDAIYAGCESGPRRRPAELDWFRDIAQQCEEAGVPLFIKQLSIDGRVSHDPNEWPEDLRIRELPYG